MSCSNGPNATFLKVLPSALSSCKETKDILAGITVVPPASGWFPTIVNLKTWPWLGPAWAANDPPNVATVSSPSMFPPLGVWRTFPFTRSSSLPSSCLPAFVLMVPVQ